MKPLPTPRTEHRALLPGGPTHTPHCWLIFECSRPQAAASPVELRERLLVSGPHSAPQRQLSPVQPPTTSNLAPRALGAWNWFLLVP